MDEQNEQSLKPSAEANLPGNQNQEILDEMRELEDLKRDREFLAKENQRLMRATEGMKKEREGMRISLSSAKSHIVSYQNSQLKLKENIDQLRIRKERLINQISELRTSVKTAREEMLASSNITASLNGEIQGINDEKKIVAKRLGAVQQGLENLSEEKKARLPNLQWYDAVLKKVYGVLKDTESRMDIAVMMNNGKK